MGPGLPIDGGLDIGVGVPMLAMGAAIGLGGLGTMGGLSGLGSAQPLPLVQQQNHHHQGQGGKSFRGRGGRAHQNGSGHTEIIPGTSIFVGNLPWKFSWQELKDLFADFKPGYADIKFGMDGRSRGYGIVRFDTPEAAQAAVVAMNGASVGDPPRNILVREDRPISTADSTIQVPQ